MSKYIYDDYDDDVVAPYKSKKHKKAAVKSKHKHKYEKVICKYFMNGKEHYCFAEECTVCGKINNYNFFIDIALNNKGYHKMFPNLDEIVEAYPNLKIISVEKLW